MKYAMMVVDVQQALVGDDLEQKDTFIANIKELLAFGREQNVEILYVRHDDGPKEELTKGKAGYEIYEEITPEDGEKVFDKCYNSAFYKTGLKEYLKEKHITNLIIMGLQTEYCVDATIKSGFEQGYRMIVPEGTITTKNNGEFTGKQLNDFYHYTIWEGRFAKVLPIEKVKDFIR
ncbi:cysteine hydrolase family protein [Anaerosporobacter faecicola]|uniref:cysteine hydrolase family protein n=1 Tax=Anaerosporobacter faecicola TaxID=2718714 RepID=UPI00143B0F4D|nr:cysteine hydrolase family protein [Anaerosporobacter faecicola]